MLRGVSDGELATLLQVERREVERRRELALERLGETLEDDSAEEARQLLGNGNGTPAPADGAAHANVAAAPPVPVPRRSPRTLVLVALGAIVASVLTLALLSGGSEEDPRLGAVPQSREPGPGGDSSTAAGSASPGVKLLPAAGTTKARASARIEGDRLELRVRDLPRSRGGYTAWLYDSVAEAVPVARFGIPNAKISARLPEGFERYRYLDLSLEPRDGNPNHSGESVLRVPLERLR